MKEGTPSNPNNTGKNDKQLTPKTEVQSGEKSQFLTPEQIEDVAKAWDLAVTQGLKGSIVAVPGRMPQVALWKPKPQSQS